MMGYIARRLAIVALSLWGLVTLSFALVSLIPGDPARVVAGPFASEEDIARIRERMGLDEPLLLRYWHYIERVAHGDLGTSFFTGASVGKSILVRVPDSLVLLIPGLVLALTIGLVLGTLGAYHRRRWPDRVVGGYVTTAQALPDFVVGLLVIYVFFSILRVAPAPLGMLEPMATPPPERTGSLIIDAVLAGSWSSVADIAAHAALPVLTLGVFLSTYFVKTVRTGMAHELSSQQIEFARACGLPERKVIGYALVSVRGSLLTYLVLLFGASLAGAAIIEIVFSWPGVGQWALDGIIKGDVPVIQGFVIVMGASILLMFVVLDIVVMLLDPRVRARIL